MPLVPKSFQRLLALTLSTSLAIGGTAQAACIDAFMTGFDEYERGETTSKARFRVNELLVLCFTTSAGGYISVFDAPKQGDFEQLYPNVLTHPDGETHALVEAGKQYCFGGRDTFPLYHPPEEGIGIGKISINLTKSPEEQLDPSDYAIPGQKVQKKTMNLHLSNHTKSGSICSARDVKYLEYSVSN
jgi:hypothetical protein